MAFSRKPYIGIIILCGLAILYVPIALIALGREAGLSWASAIPGLCLLGIWLGLASRRIWLSPRHLREAESLWQRGETAQQVLKPLNRSLTAKGELGYRIHLLRSLAYLELGDRPRAWQASFRAGLARLPFWHRCPINLYLAFQAKLPEAWNSSLADFLGRRLRQGHRFHHYLAAQKFRTGEPDKAWPLLELSLEGCLEDPLVLEDLMISSLGRMQGQDIPEEMMSLLRRILDRSLHVLLYRHGGPRCAWDRLAVLPHLLATGRPEEVLALVRSLPESRRSMGLWEAESIALRELGNLTAAEDVVLRGLDRFPGSFRLWMEHHAHALQRRDASQALHALEEARPLLEGQEDTATAHWEWMLKRAEFAYWVEGDAAQAWNLLSGVPQTHQGRHAPPFRLQLQVSLGHYAEALPTVQALLEQRPEDLDLRLLQADCMGGMEAWEALLPFLESFPSMAASRSDYWHILGLSHAHLQHRLPARECLERASAMEPSQLRFVLDAGHACMELAELNRAEYHWRRALELDSKCEEALLQLSETRRALHDLAGAKAILRECLLANPESEEAQGYLAELEAN